jgi:uncharacterized protein
MLASAFVFLNGIGPATERGLWQNSTADWTSFFERPSSPSISSTRKSWYDKNLVTAQSQLAAGQADFFETCLKSHDYWRLFETFRHCTLSLDIETTDLSAHEGLVTVVGLCRNQRMRPS